MNLVPYKKIVIQTHLQPSEAVKLLSQAVFTDLPPFLYVVGPMDFYAEITEDRFTAYRLIRHRNGFNAVLHGRFVPMPTGTNVQVHMYPPLINIAVATVLAGFPLYFLAQAFFKWLVSGQTFSDPLAFLPIPIVVYLITMSGFDPEANRAQAFLNGIYASETSA